MGKLELKVLDVHFHWKCTIHPPMPTTIVCHIDGDCPTKINENVQKAVEELVTQFYMLCTQSREKPFAISCKVFPEIKIVTINIVPPCLQEAYLEKVKRVEKSFQKFLAGLVRQTSSVSSTGWEQFTN